VGVSLDAIPSLEPCCIKTSPRREKSSQEENRTESRSRPLYVMGAVSARCRKKIERGKEKRRGNRGNYFTLLSIDRKHLCKAWPEKRGMWANNRTKTDLPAFCWEAFWGHIET